MLESAKGPGGGYRLARPAAEIALLEVVEVVEDPLWARGLEEHGPLDRALRECPEAATRAEVTDFKSITLADLMRR